MATPKIVKLSAGNTKLGALLNVSLPPVKACGNCSACRKSCYALKAWRMYPIVRKHWTSNHRLAVKDRAAYFASIRAQFAAKRLLRFFRWHVSGDILDQAYLDEMCAIAREFPQISFLAFTKMHALNYGARPANLSVVLSMWPTMPMPARQGLPIAWMQDGTETRVTANALQCPGSCDACGMCFNLGELNRDVVFAKH
jgi:ferredoxin